MPSEAIDRPRAQFSASEIRADVPDAGGQTAFETILLVALELNVQCEVEQFFRPFAVEVIDAFVVHAHQIVRNLVLRRYVFWASNN